MPSRDSLGDRMKRYESAATHALTPRTPVIVRVDGRAFHTWTRGAIKPFDYSIMAGMTTATRCVAHDMQGCVLAYTQSDETSFFLRDYAAIESQPWFDYGLAKVVSITASMFTAQFNAIQTRGPATFDARAFNIPEADVANYFLWRMQDWRRNSIQMLAQSMFSPKQLHGKKIADLLAMCVVAGHDWVDLPAHVKYGTLYSPLHRLAYHVEPSYDNVHVVLESALF